MTVMSSSDPCLSLVDLNELLGGGVPICLSSSPLHEQSTKHRDAPSELAGAVLTRQHKQSSLPREVDGSWGGGSRGVVTQRQVGMDMLPDWTKIHGIPGGGFWGSRLSFGAQTENGIRGNRKRGIFGPQVDAHISGKQPIHSHWCSGVWWRKLVLFLVPFRSLLIK